MPLVTRSQFNANVFREDSEPAGWQDGDLWVDTTDGQLNVNVSGTATQVGINTQWKVLFDGTQADDVAVTFSSDVISDNQLLCVIVMGDGINGNDEVAIRIGRTTVDTSGYSGGISQDLAAFTSSADRWAINLANNAEEFYSIVWITNESGQITLMSGHGSTQNANHQLIKGALTSTDISNIVQVLPTSSAVLTLRRTRMIILGQN